MARIDVERPIDADPTSVALLLADPTLDGLPASPAEPMQRTPTSFVGRFVIERLPAVVTLEYATSTVGATATRARVRVDDAGADPARAFLDRLATVAEERARVA